MTTAEELIKKEFPDWQDWAEWGLEGTIHIMREYAQEVAQDALNRAAKSARVKTKTQYDSEDTWKVNDVDRDSIKNTQIILP